LRPHPPHVPAQAKKAFRGSRGRQYMDKKNTNAKKMNKKISVAALRNGWGQRVEYQR
jgi:hypothetical protein